MDTTPYWFEGAGTPSFPPLGEDLKVDVLVIGGGITGVTAAYLLGREGLSVALVERERIGGRDTGHTTAHLTYMTDTRLSDVVSTFGKREARLSWQAGQDAMNFIRATVNEHGIDCGLIPVPGFLAAAEGKDRQEAGSLLQEEASLARDFGFEAAIIESDPVTGRPAIRFENQMKFHPLRYLAALSKQAAESGVRIFENIEVTEFSEDQREVTAGNHKISFQDVVVATHVPLQGNTGTAGAAMFQTKLLLYSSYAIRAGLPGGSLDELIWSDTADPFLYLRVDRDHAILGGEDHKTGQKVDNEDCYRRLEERLARVAPGATVTHRWSGQVVETVDGLPFIGSTGNGQFIATGFSGNGMTFGTLSAMMARDSITGRSNPYTAVFSPGRKKFTAIGTFLRENSDFPVRMVTDRLRVPEEDPAHLPCGAGKVLEHDGERMAAYRDEKGELHLVSAVCPHMGGIVAWNEAEKTWDCPCHGSRFKATGEVIAGPAESSLEAMAVAAAGN